MWLRGLYMKRFSIVLQVSLFYHFLFEAECLSLEIKGGQSKFTFAEGVMSDILFYVNNNNRNNSGITLYVSKDGQRQDANVCKYVLTNTTCVNHSLSCECHTNSSEGRVEYIFQKKFQVNDSGEWVFEVWDRGVSTSVYITVQDIQSTMAPTLAKLSTSRQRSTSTTFTSTTQNRHNTCQHQKVLHTLQTVDLLMSGTWPPLSSPLVSLLLSLVSLPTSSWRCLHIHRMRQNSKVLARKLPS
ncbi:uncharacterized protein LOC112568958 [Pomacea canaliculata]|uniref:uncharacterized protein LOC112568958 n=1 Tax=Pomacea canaliculata TaxID=400727 RepID=UPI000D73A3D1|nr:uncharacterized protein LOC112568958 [Pomacea canaliculata]